MPPINLRHVFVLTPEIVLGAWGLLLLLIDLGPLRGRSSSDRQRILGRWAMAGALLSLVTTLFLLIVRFDIAGASTGLLSQRGWYDLTGIDLVSHPDPVVFGGTISADLLDECFNLLFTSLLALVIGLSGSWSFTDNWGEYFALLLWSTVGMMLLTASEELLTMFLTLEMMTICLYLLTAFEKDKKRSAEGGLKYFVYGSVSSALLLFGFSMIYGLTGSTRLIGIHDALVPVSDVSIGLAGNVAGAVAVLLVLVGFGFKVAAVPFHQWAPDVYEGAPAPVTALVATGSKVASLIALMKLLLFGLGAWASGGKSFTSPGWLMVVAVVSALSMTYGNFAALGQTNLKRMLAYSSIAHAGYMLVGVCAAGLSARHEVAAGSVIFYLVVYAFSTIGAFAVAAWLARDRGSDQISDLNGMASSHPLYAVCILLIMLSLIGLPILAGFFGKLYMFMEALDQSTNRPGRMNLLWLVALGLINSVVSAFYYVRVLKAMFLRPRNPDVKALEEPSRAVAISILLGTLVVVGLGLYPPALMDMARSMALAMLSDGGRTGLDVMKNVPSAPPPYVAPRMPIGASPGGGGGGAPNPPAIPGQETSPIPQKGAQGKGAIRKGAPGKGAQGKGAAAKGAGKAATKGAGTTPPPGEGAATPATKGEQDKEKQAAPKPEA